MKGRNQALSRSPRNNGRNPNFMDTNLADQSGLDFSQPPVSIDQSDDKLGPSNSFSPQGKGHPNVNGLVRQSEGGFEFGSVGCIPVEPQLQERGGHQQQRYLSPPESSSPVSPTIGMQKLKPVLSGDHNRYTRNLLVNTSKYYLNVDDYFVLISFFSVVGLVGFQSSHHTI